MVNQLDIGEYLNRVGSIEERQTSVCLPESASDAVRKKGAGA
jgi:hypothetical protein